MRDKEIIKLRNRYGELVYLEHIDNNDYLLKGSEGAMSYYRVVYDPKDPNKIYAVDPSGGPFLAVGKTLSEANRTIVSIQPGNIITLSDETN